MERGGIIVTLIGILIAGFLWLLRLNTFDMLCSLNYPPIAYPVTIVACIAPFGILLSAFFAGPYSTADDGPGNSNATRNFEFTLPFSVRDRVMVHFDMAFRTTRIAISVAILFIIAAGIILWGTGLDFRFWPICDYMHSESHVVILLASMLAGCFLLAWSLYCNSFLLLSVFLINMIAMYTLSALGTLNIVPSAWIECLKACSNIGISVLIIVGCAFHFGRRAWTDSLLPRKILLLFTLATPVAMLFGAYATHYLIQDTSLDYYLRTQMIVGGMLIGCSPAASAFSLAAGLQKERYH